VKILIYATVLYEQDTVIFITDKCLFSI